MRCAALNPTTRSRNKPFYRRRSQTSREFLILGFLALDDWDSKEFFVNACVKIEDFKDFFHGLFLGEMGCMTFLPQELTRTKERLRMFKFPTDDYISSLLDRMHQNSID